MVKSENLGKIWNFGQHLKIWKTFEIVVKIWKFETYWDVMEHNPGDFINPTKSGDRQKKLGPFIY